MEMIAVASEVKKEGGFIGVPNKDGGREIGDEVLGEGESAAGCDNGVNKGCGGDDEDTMENWTRRKDRSRA
ncbi:hypothetical protein Pyn_38129 [Prunus yedoensis var. nudiflora]|uniref:Uncharacterized protein n=1 Tax=Prunus yedoensis var. nudiflora TaxID=2094558 RepID=A0A314Y333_PRUYE|nr:hypothetical protein Pyn_38129 [Prunus yedoensis var. nudiflora]